MGFLDDWLNGRRAQNAIAGLVGTPDFNPINVSPRVQAPGQNNGFDYGGQIGPYSGGLVAPEHAAAISTMLSALPPSIALGIIGKLTNDVATNDIGPKEGFTLGPGQQRFGPTGTPIASAPEAEDFGAPIPLGNGQFGRFGNRGGFKMVGADMAPKPKVDVNNGVAYDPYNTAPGTVLGQVQTLSDDEAKALGLPPGTYQRGVDGKISTVSKSDVLSPQAFDQQVKLSGAKDQARVDAENGGSQALDPNAIDYVAQQYMITGQMPPLGMGKDAAKMRQQIINRASEIEGETGATGADAAQRHAANKANTQALGRVTGTSAMIGSFEQTAQKNADIVLNLLDKGSAKSGVPVLNAWIQAGRRSVTGDPNVSAFDTALTTFKNEYARVVNSATGGGVTTDSARQEIEHILNAAQTPEQVRAAIAVAKRDMANRTSSLNEAKTNLGATIRGSAGAKPAPAAGLPQGWKYLGPVKQ